MSDENVQEIPVTELTDRQKDRQRGTSALDVLREQVEMRVGPPDETVITFEYCYDLSVKKKSRMYYTFVSLWIAATGQWYTSGRGGGVPREASNEDLLKVLASANVKSARVAIEFSAFKP